ncbi:MAG: flagellar basal body-associated FliL family protein [Nitrospirae bacterium]|nr:flagellar basal body-associated FliL family protein [Nitrospirota bacterium]
MKIWSVAALAALLLAPSCKKPGTPPEKSAASTKSAEVPLGAAAALVPSGIEAPEAAATNAPTILTLPPTTGTLTDRQKLRLVVVLDLDSPETRREAEGRMHEYQDYIILILADRSSNDLLNSFARDDLRYAIFEAIRNTLPPRGLKKVYFTEFVIE